MLEPATFIGLGCRLGRLSIEIAPGDPPEPDAGVLERWSEATRLNPRLFNGPILRFVSFDREALVVRAARDTYQRYAMQRHDAATASPERDVYHLAVTGVVQTSDARGRACVVIGRRGESTFVYPGMWELAPGGGLEGPDVYAQLMREMEEELGMPGLADGSRRDALLHPPGPGDVLGISIDPNTPSVDVVVRVRLRAGASLGGAGGEAGGEHAWEYGATRRLPVAEIPAFAAAEGERVIPPTLAIWGGLGWL